MTKEIIKYIEKLERMANQSNDYFMQRNKLYVENQKLKKENEKLKEDFEKVQQEYWDVSDIELELFARIDKAMEEIKYLETNADITEIGAIKLKQILKGEE